MDGMDEIVSRRLNIQGLEFVEAYTYSSVASLPFRHFFYAYLVSVNNHVSVRKDERQALFAIACVANACTFQSSSALSFSC